MFSLMYVQLYKHDYSKQSHLVHFWGITSALELCTNTCYQRVSLSTSKTTSF